MQFINYRIPSQGRNRYRSTGGNSTVISSSAIVGGSAVPAPVNPGTNTGTTGGGTTIIYSGASSEWYNIHIKTLQHRYKLVKTDDWNGIQTDSNDPTVMKYQRKEYEDGTVRTIYRADNDEIHIFDLDVGTIAKDYTYTKLTKSSGSNVFKEEKVDVTYQHNPSSGYQTGRTVTRTTVNKPLSQWVEPFDPASTALSGTGYYDNFYVLVDNFDAKLVNNPDYRFVYLRWKPSSESKNDWRVPMFSELWDMSGNTSSPTVECKVPFEDTWWPILRNEQLIFDQTGHKPAFDVLDMRVSERYRKMWFHRYGEIQNPWYTMNKPRYVWKVNHNLKQRIGVAIYKRTSGSRLGWQRISNIAEIDCYLTNQQYTDFFGKTSYRYYFETPPID